MEIRKHIIKTICFFDLFDRPLLDTEVHKYLVGKKANLKTVRRHLRKMSGEKLSRKGNLFCLKGRQGIFEIYKKRKKITAKKWRKAKFVAAMLRKTPFIRGVAVSQNLAIDNTKKSSDIDFFIITSKNKLWTSRLLVNLILDLFRLRNPKSKSPICPSFIIAKDNLNLKKIAIRNDIYFAFWSSSLVPLFGENIFKQFLKENYWTKKYFSNIGELKSNLIKTNWLLWSVQKFLEIIFLPFSLFEQGLMKIQIEKIRKNSEKFQNPSLKLDKKTAKIHYEDKRKLYQSKWKKLVDINT